MNDFQDFVKTSADNLKNARQIPLGASEFPAVIPRSAQAPVGMIFSPHPDDECINGGLPLRLFRESGYRIINVPITLGSDLERRAARRHELENACRYLGFGVIFPVENGFENITPAAREIDIENWSYAVSKIADLIKRFQPKVLFFPHRKDRHPTHCGTNLLVLDALSKMPKDFICMTAENEFWQPMETPDCLIEISEETVGDLISALSFHVGEVSRNPYHITFPSWLIDNVRRGSEIVGEAGSKSQDFTFGVLHKISLYKNGALQPMFEQGKFLSMTDRF